MKQLRVLTGLHAGAQLRLASSQYRIGADDEADVLISDWTHEPLLLTVDEGKVMLALSIENAESEGPMAGFPAWLEDFMPRRFLDIVLCVGPADEPWPSDVDLLQRLLGAPAVPEVVAPVEPQVVEPPPRPKRHGGLVVAGLASCGVLLAVFTTLLLGNASKVEARATKPSLLVQVRLALQQKGMEDLSIQESGRQVVVEGVVPTMTDFGRVRSLLTPIAADGIVHRYAAADVISQAITDTLADPGLRVSYRGKGHFLIEGRTLEPERVQASAQRLAVDLGQAVKHIDVQVEALPPPERVRVDAMLSTDGVQYVQTRDGTKHLTISSPEGADSAVGGP